MPTKRAPTAGALAPPSQMMRRSSGLQRPMLAKSTTSSHTRSRGALMVTDASSMVGTVALEVGKFRGDDAVCPRAARGRRGGGARMSPVIQTRFDKKAATVEGVVAAMRAEGYCIVDRMLSKPKIRAIKADQLDVFG